ncbi:MAG: glycosyltransferase family 1 protein, partial [Candidatus Hydrogenedentes bacterium]|nr:glycosyltransferase family 1 protein [Candidatus Hydrogenedentota bacterium]
IRSARGDIPQHFTRWSGRIFQCWILHGLKRAQRVMCVSEQTRVELLRVAGLSSNRVAVVDNALNYPYSPMSEGEALQRLQRLGLEPAQPFLLHVGGNQWYKNREGMLRIFNAVRATPGSKDYRLVMVGPPWTAPMRSYVKRAGLQDRVTARTNVANEHLRALYATAEALIFPSLYEGFGWPIIEAQACGCPVFTTGRPPMTEAGGSAAAYFDPLDERAAARTIAEGLEDRHKMVEGGIANAARFSTEAMVHGYLAAYQAVIAETASQHHSAACPE